MGDIIDLLIFVEEQYIHSNNFLSFSFSIGKSVTQIKTILIHLHHIKEISFYSKKMISYEVPSWKSIEIDSQTDLVIAECIKKNLHRFKRYDSKIFD